MAERSYLLECAKFVKTCYVVLSYVESICSQTFPASNFRVASKDSREVSGSGGGGGGGGGRLVTDLVVGEEAGEDVVGVGAGGAGRGGGREEVVAELGEQRARRRSVPQQARRAHRRRLHREVQILGNRRAVHPLLSSLLQQNSNSPTSTHQIKQQQQPPTSYLRLLAMAAHTTSIQQHKKEIKRRK